LSSYKSCPYYDKSLGKKRGKKLSDNEKCKTAINNRCCRRCSLVPLTKLELWKKEREDYNGENT